MSRNDSKSQDPSTGKNSHGGQDQGKAKASLSIGNRIRLSGTVLLMSVQDFLTDNATAWAASIAYYTLLSAFPLLIAVVSIASFFVDSNWAVTQLTHMLGNYVPQGMGQIQQVVQQTFSARGAVSIFSTLALVLSGSRVFGIVAMALNIAFDVKNDYGFLKRVLVEVLMMLTLGSFFLLAFASFGVLGFLFRTLPGLGGIGQLASQSIQTLAPGLLLLLAFFLTYRFVPRRRPTWQAALSGSVTATLVFVLAQPIFVYYLGNFTNYSLVYGSLTGLVIGILWVWVGALILLLGGEVASHTQMLLEEGVSPQEVKARHLKNSLDQRVQDGVREATSTVRKGEREAR